MDTLFWLVFLFILAGSIRRLMERAGSKDNYKGPPVGFPPETESPVPYAEEKPELIIPEYLTRREEQPAYDSTDGYNGREREVWQIEQYPDPAVWDGNTAKPSLKRQPAGLPPESTYTAVNVPISVEGSKGHSVTKKPEQSRQEEPFSSMLRPEQVLWGMAWMQILGPRGGLRPVRHKFPGGMRF